MATTSSNSSGMLAVEVYAYAEPELLRERRVAYDSATARSALRAPIRIAVERFTGKMS